MTTQQHVLERWLRACLVALAFTLASGPIGGLVATAAPAESSAPSRARPAAAETRPATAKELDSYRQREAQAPAEMARFSGGDTLVITASTLVAVLLIVLLVVLIV